MICDNVLLKSM